MNYDPLLKERWPDSYFDDRTNNNPQRAAQFKLDKEFIFHFVSEGVVCDVGCSTGEFLRSLEWRGQAYGIEINDHARDLARDIVSFERNIFTESDFFDLVIFRGSIQHVDEPFRMMKYSFRALKPGGHICFLATPNSNSILYKTKDTLPFLDPRTNFYIPGARELGNALANFGFKVVRIEYPYFGTPYCNLVGDHVKFVANLLTPWFFRHAFWRSSMNVMAVKPK